MLEKTKYPPTDGQVRLLKGRFKITPHPLMSKSEARTLITFIIEGNGHPRFMEALGRLSYYKMMQDKYENRRALEFPSMKSYIILYFIPYTKEEFIEEARERVIYACVRAPNGGIMDLHFTALREPARK